MICPQFFCTKTHFFLKRYIFYLENGQKINQFLIDVFYFEELIDVSYILTF